MNDVNSPIDLLVYDNADFAARSALPTTMEYKRSLPLAGCYMDNKTVALEWQRYAAQDLSSAEFLLTMKPQPLEIICYHCQQCAEKNLKSFMAYQGARITV